MSRIALAFMVLAVSVAAQGPVRVNGFSTGTPDHVELINCSSVAVDVSGWTVATAYSLGAGAVAETPFVLPGAAGSGTTVIPAGGFLILEEFGTAGAPGTLPNSIAVGFNYFWIAARTTIVWITDDAGIGQDYVYRDFSGEGGAPFLPGGTSWVSAAGTYTGGTTDFSERLNDIDTDTSVDWGDVPAATTAALNAGQSGVCSYNPLPATFQINSSDASLDVNGVLGNPYAAATQIVNDGEIVSMNIGSSLVGNGHDIGVTFGASPVAAGSGGLTTAGGQFVNLSFAGGLPTFVFGGSIGNYPTPFAGNNSLVFAAPSGLAASAQMVIGNPAAPDGFSLSAANELISVPCTSSTTFDTLATGAALDTGWTNGSNGNLTWTVQTGGTGSVGTGPTGAFSVPNYLYCETSIAHPGTFSFDTCAISTASLTMNQISFELSRIGAAIATLEVQISDAGGPFTTIAGGTFMGADPAQAQGGIEWTTTTISLPPLLGPTFKVRFLYSGTTTFTGDIAIDDLVIN